ncbi:MAG: hypothetical protein ACOY3O_12460 [Thermodesulfobacteriota bacterium]
MSKQTDPAPKVTPSSTKKEILDAYHELRAQLAEKAGQTLQPEKKKEERQIREATAVAEEMAASGTSDAIAALKNRINAALADISERMEEQNIRYRQVKEAIAAKEQELAEVFEIERAAHSLAALLEAQRQKRETFERDMTARREELEGEIEKTRAAWEDEQAEMKARVKEQQEQTEKKRRREQEEFEYAQKREREQKTNDLRDEIARLEKELAQKREEFEKKVTAKETELRERETAVAADETRIATLAARVEHFPAELEGAITKAVKETTSRLNGEAAKNEELLRKTFEGERNVLATRIEALDQLAAEQKKQLELLAGQLEKAYGKVQDIAVKAVSSPRERYFGEAQAKSSGPQDGK